MKIRLKKLKGRRHLPPPPKIHKDRTKYNRTREKRVVVRGFKLDEER